MCFAIAIKCVVQLLEAPIALATITAFSNALRVIIFDGFKSS